MIAKTKPCPAASDYQCPASERSAAIAKGMVPFRDWYDGKRVYHDFILQEPLPAPLHVTVEVFAFDWFMAMMVGYWVGMSLLVGLMLGWFARDNLSHWLKLAVASLWATLRAQLGL